MLLLLLLLPDGMSSLFRLHQSHTNVVCAVCVKSEWRVEGVSSSSRQLVKGHTHTHELNISREKRRRIRRRRKKRL